MGLLYGGLILGAGLLVYYWYKLRADLLTTEWGSPSARRVDEYSLAVRDDIAQEREDFDPLGGFEEGALAGATGGFAIGGPIGAVIGAILGGAWGVISEIIEQEHGEDVMRQTIRNALKHDKLPSTSRHINYVLHQMLLQQYAGPLAIRKDGKIALVMQTDSQFRLMAELQESRAHDERWALTGWASSYFLNLRNYVNRDYPLFGGDDRLKPEVKGKLFPMYWYGSEIRRWTGVPYLVGEHLDIERRPVSARGWKVVQPISDLDVIKHMRWWGEQNGISWPKDPHSGILGLFGG